VLHIPHSQVLTKKVPAPILGTMRKPEAKLQFQVDILEQRLREISPELLERARAAVDSRVDELTRPNFPVSPRERAIIAVPILSRMAARAVGIGE
jgi:hypothetical protein